MTQPDPADQPATAAGLRAYERGWSVRTVVAIERESVTAWLASPAAVEELAVALNDESMDVTYYKRDLHGEDLIPRSAAYLILQALLAARQEKGDG